jgi:serine/threonine protein phosphatase PrpC
MRNYATAQEVGGRDRQCDATAVAAGPGGVMAYALLDGIGSEPEVARWTRAAAHRVAFTAVRHRDAADGLRAVYDHYAADPERKWRDDLPQAAAVVAVTAPGRPLTVAWSGDSRAYLLRGGVLERLTEDHNLRRVQGGPANLLTACLGATDTDDELRKDVGHPAVESTRRTLAHPWARLALFSDGGYEPLEQSCVRMEDYLVGAVEDVPGGLVSMALECGGIRPDNATALVADLHQGIHY